MFVINEDNSIYATRGDIVFFSVSAEDDGVKHTFQAGDVVRFKVYGKKDAETVVLQKDFPVTENTSEVEIFLNEEDTKIGEVISKPKDYWYEVELNPGDNPQTIIGYDEDGAKVFKLFPEGDDINEYKPDPEDFPVVDEELDMASPRPIANSAVAKELAEIKAGYDAVWEAVAELHVTPQMFGAVGDGVADDTNAVQDAVNHGGKVVFSNGTFLVSKTIDLPSDISIYFENAKVVKVNNPDEKIFSASGESNIRIFGADIEGGGSDDNVSDQGSAVFFYNCDNVYVDGLKTRNTYGDGLQIRNSHGRFINLDIDAYGRNAISPTSGDIEIINAQIGNCLSGANPGCNIDIEPNSADESANVLVSNAVLHDRINIYNAYSTKKLNVSARIENCHFVGMYRAILVKAVNNVSGADIHIASDNVFDSVNVGGIEIDNVNDVTLDGLRFVNTSPAQVNLKNTTSNITIKNIKSFYLYGANCDGLVVENSKIGYYAVNSAVNATFKNCLMNRFASDCSFGNACFEGVSEQDFKSGSDFSVSIPVPNNTVKAYLVIVNANGNVATVRAAIIAVINGSSASSVSELASHGNLAVDYAISGGLLTITPSDNYGGTLTVRAL